jgi:hypothetical protein
MFTFVRATDSANSFRKSITTTGYSVGRVIMMEDGTMVVVGVIGTERALLM